MQVLLATVCKQVLSAAFAIFVASSWMPAAYSLAPGRYLTRTLLLAEGHKTTAQRLQAGNVLSATK